MMVRCDGCLCPSSDVFPVRCCTAAPLLHLCPSCRVDILGACSG